MRNYAQSIMAVNSPDSEKQHESSQDKNKILFFDVSSVKWAREKATSTRGDSVRTEKEVANKKNRRSSLANSSHQNSDNKDEYIEALRLWVSSARLNEAMERKELAQLEGIHRLIVLAKGLLPNIIRLCRRAKRADTRMGVLAIVHLCADNDDGLCRLSVARFGQLLCRKDASVHEALSDLEAGGEIHIEHSPNGNSYWPRIPIGISHINPSMGWLVDGLSDKPRTTGRPSGKRTPLTRGVLSNVDDVVSPSDLDDFQQKNDASNLQQGVLHKKNVPPLRGETYPPYAGTYITKLNHSEEEIANKRDHSRCGNTCEGISRPGCAGEADNSEVL